MCRLPGGLISLRAAEASKVNLFLVFAITGGAALNTQLLGCHLNAASDSCAQLGMGLVPSRRLKVDAGQATVINASRVSDQTFLLQGSFMARDPVRKFVSTTTIPSKKKAL